MFQWIKLYVSTIWGNLSSVLIIFTAHIHSISEEPLHGDSSSLSSFDEPNLYFERPIRASSENTALSSVYSLKEEEEECEDTMATIPLENKDTITTIENETNNMYPIQDMYLCT